MTREYIIEAYKNLKATLDRQPSQDEFYNKTTVTNHYLLKSGFRTYSQLVEEMGDVPKAFFHNGISKEDYLLSYGNMVRLLKKIPSTSDWKFYNGKPTIINYKRKFEVNSWGLIAHKFYDFAKEKDEWKDIIEFMPMPEEALPRIEKRSEECYVYFMFDTKTLLYKIGISNQPEWRERTLQSEKPSIELRAKKKFVNRRIAASFEKALHDSYSHKRIRGEWFQLDQEDIDEITATLA